ncbi:MAG: alpha/beta hydrolase [Nocardioides sp.]|uniref:alpha/beta hydrolase n=1 Tax=Nocardioides sp. TaxID=35761 RepID=UPI0039E5060B
MRGWTLTGLVAATGLMTTALAVVPADAATGAEPVAVRTATEVSAPVPTLNWTKCPEYGRRMRCATASVPLDYDHPSGPAIKLSLSKLPAKNQAAKLGSLFVNPGGPGGTATDFTPFAAQLLGRTVRQKYDVIGIDPRGVGAHSQVVCRGTRPIPTGLAFPITVKQSRQAWAAAQWERRACQKDGNAIVAHMSTADTARDMDLIRQAVGDQVLNYYGISYGTYLGATYAAMFPDRVGRLVVDGVLDPVKWATGSASTRNRPFSTRVNSARGAYEALVSALDECDRVGTKRCAFAGGATAKWRTLARRAKHGRLRYGGDRLSYQDLVGGTLSMMYDGRSYRFLARFLNQLWRASQQPGKHRTARGLTAARIRKMAQQVIAAPYAPTAARRTVPFSDGFAGVACADTVNPKKRAAWWHAGRSQDRRSPWFGSLWTWVSSACANWPARYSADAYRGPFKATTANPVLIVGNAHDPATPVSGARRLATLLDGSRFLLMNGWGHGALGNSCVTAAYNRYYATGTLPAEGKVCAADRPLFPKRS